jgi:spermidine synthase
MVRAAVSSSAASAPTHAEPFAESVPRELARTTPFWVPVALFVFSGATGLVDQLCFSKYLSYIVGSTAHAVSAVLAAFMAGLALGAHFGGKRTLSTRRPLLVYGVLELVVAASVAVAPFAFHALTPLYVSLARSAPGSLATLSALRWCLAMVVVVLPTTAMGATLPFLSRALGEGPAETVDEARVRARRLGILYAANTAGGGIGALGAAYLVLPALGLTRTLMLAALVSAVIGAVAIVLGRRSRGIAAERPEPVPADSDLRPPSAGLAEPPSRELVLLTALAFGSGYLVFSAEVVFTHLLALIIGNSAYAFGLILAVFLICLFFGASRAPALARRSGERALPTSLLFTGAALALTLPVWDRMPLLFAGSGSYITSFAGRETLRAVAAFLILGLPVSFMGLTFPLLLQRVAPYATVGRLVGRLTAVNTVGAVVGSLVTGYLVLPALGSQRVLAASALFFVLLALATALVHAPTARKSTALGLGLCTLFVLFTPRWDLSRLTSGNNVYFDGKGEPEQIVMMAEDVHGGVTTVTRHRNVLTLYTNGKFQGNNGWELNAQRFFAHYPSLFVTRYDRALVIGLGTGTTLGTIASYPWKSIDVAEISPNIVKAAHGYFQEINLGVLDDPRVHLHLADGRNYVLLGSDRYQMISMELSSIWFAGASSLYSRDFYHQVHARLLPGGIFQQWVQLHHMTERDFATILNTLASEFEHVVLFYGGGQGILVASSAPLVASRAHIAELQNDPQVNRTIPGNRPLQSLFNDVLVGDRGLRRFVDDVAKRAGVPTAELVSNDDNLYLEYATPKSNVLPWDARERLVETIERERDLDEIRAMLGP